MPKVAFITAILGGYEKTCKPFVKQTVDTDFICFTDDANIITNGWLVDTNPYHYTHPSSVDNGFYINSIHKSKKLSDYKMQAIIPQLFSNTHTFNLAKYYKQAWHNIPRLKDYDVVIWLDGTIEITSPDVSEYMLKLCAQYNIVGWQHEYRAGNLVWEVEASFLPRYHDLNYLNQKQPYQDCVRQYHEYVEQGYDEKFWDTYPRKEGRGWGNHFGMWVTCFVAFNNRNPDVKKFLDLWYLQTLKYTTQDQIGFPKVVQDTKIVPYTLPDEVFTGNEPHKSTSIFIKRDHGT